MTAKQAQKKLEQVRKAKEKADKAAARKVAQELARLKRSVQKELPEWRKDADWKIEAAIRTGATSVSMATGCGQIGMLRSHALVNKLKKDGFNAIPECYEESDADGYPKGPECWNVIIVWSKQ